jgi:hypothetical protein
MLNLYIKLKPIIYKFVSAKKMSIIRPLAEPVGPGRLTPWWIWLMIILIVIVLQIERCCYTCEYDIGCSACPNGYPCMFPCSGSC